MHLSRGLSGVLIGVLAPVLWLEGCSPTTPSVSPPTAANQMAAASTQTTAVAPEPAPGPASFLPTPAVPPAETMVTGVTFETRAQQSVVVVETSGALPQVQIKQRQHPPRLALDLPRARLDTSHARVLPVNDPQGVVTQLATLPLQHDNESGVKVVVYLQEVTPFEVQQDHHVVRLALTKAAVSAVHPMVVTPTATSVMATAAVTPAHGLALPPGTVLPATSPLPRMVAQLTPATPGSVLPGGSQQGAVPPPPPLPLSPAVSERQPKLAPVAPRQYTGKKISLDFQDADIKDLLRLISEVSGFNVIAGGDVQGTVTTRMVDVPWDQALDVILKINGLDQEREGNIIRVAPLERFTQEREERLRARMTEQRVEPLITRIIPINYSPAATLKANLEKQLSDRGSLFIDERTNNVIITDTQRNLDDVLALITTLDRATPQVMIEARIVESSRNFLRELGVQIGLSQSTTTDQTFPSTINVHGAGIPNTPQLGSIAPPPGNFLVDLPAAVASGAGGGIGFALASIGGDFLDVQLSALEASGRGKVISSPRIATLDNSEAKIQSGRKIPYATVSQEGTRTEFVEANLSLTVTPHVTPNDYISLKIATTRDAADFGNVSGGVPTIINREANTTMLVKDGDTVVIGGLYTRTISDSTNGVPFLSKIPVLGWLFQRTSTQDDTEELLIFITPRIIRQPIETPGKTRAVIN